MPTYNIILDKFKPQTPVFNYVPSITIGVPSIFVPIGLSNIGMGSGSQFDNIYSPDQYLYLNSKEARASSSQLMGISVFCDLILVDTTADPEEQIQLLQVLITANSNAKNIVRTVVQGRSGTVKEYISDGDYNFTIQGGLFDTNKTRYPIEDSRKLARLCSVPAALKVISPLLNDVFDIHYLVVIDREFPQSEGKQNVQLFNIKAISDDPPELNIS